MINHVCKFFLFLFFKKSFDIFGAFTTTQKMKFSIKEFFSKCDQIRRFGHFYWRNP